MPEFLEKKLKAEYGAKSGIPYAVMNKMKLMRGNKETAKGAAMQRKHDESKETPQMEAGSHPASFLKSALKAKLSKKSAAGIRAKAMKGMK